MLDQIAFQSGAFFTLSTLIFTFTIWILAAFHRLRIESVGILQAPLIQLYKVKIKSVELILGWFPLGSFVKIAGMMDETLDADSSSNTTDIPAYEFRGRPFRTKLLIVMTSPLLLILMGLLLLNTTSFPLLEWLTTYLKINFFQLPLEAGASIWNAFYTKPIFLLGSIFLFLGLGNLGNNLGNLLNNNNLTWLFFFLPLFFLFLSLGIFRLAWSTFVLLNLLYFF
ncbi:MAG: hypothetical protein JKY03_01710 [Aureispira sp.]|nr:hypothetical protein [Aureispira sp.]